MIKKIFKLNGLGSQRWRKCYFSILDKDNSTIFQKQMGLHKEIQRVHKVQIKKEKKEEFKASIPLFILGTIIIFLLINHDEKRKRKYRSIFEIELMKLKSSLVSMSSLQKELLQCYYKNSLILREIQKRGYFLIQQVNEYVNRNKGRLGKEEWRKIFEIMDINLEWINDRPNKRSLCIIRQLVIKLRDYRQQNNKVFNKMCKLLGKHGNLQMQYIHCLYYGYDPQIIAKLNKNIAIMQNQYALINKYQHLKFKYQLSKKQLFFILNTIQNHTQNQPIQISSSFYHRLLQ